jgi:hypothetical protein
MFRRICLGPCLRGGSISVEGLFAHYELIIDAEIKKFKNVNTPAIFLQNVITDLILGLGMNDILKAFKTYVEKKYNAEASFINTNMPKLVSVFEEISVENLIISASINKLGFRMSGSKGRYEQGLREKTKGRCHAKTGSLCHTTKGSGRIYLFIT